VESRFFDDAVHEFMLATLRANIGGRIFERNRAKFLTNVGPKPANSRRWRKEADKECVAENLLDQLA
jgi:hypothetical protein